MDTEYACAHCDELIAVSYLTDDGDEVTCPKCGGVNVVCERFERWLAMIDESEDDDGDGDD
jgi:DNA-directed RNA polymerase subunit RPC12/RpoP